MKNNHPRRNRFRSNSRGYRRNGVNGHSHKVPNFGSVTQNHGYYNRNNQNASKMFEKYTNLAKEALSSGDKILYENYLQHAEHFIRLSENFSDASNSKNSSSKVVDEIKINNINEKNSKQDEKLEVKES